MESSVLSSKFLSSCRHCRPFQTQWEVCRVDVLVTSLPLHRLPLQLNQLIGVTLQHSGSYATQDLWDTRQWIFFSAQPYSKESKLFQGFYINYDLLMMSQKEAPRKHPWVLPSIETQKPTCLLTHSRMTETRFEGTCSRRNRSYLESMRAQYRRSSISRLGHHCKLKDDTAYYSYLIMCMIQEARKCYILYA